MTKQQFIIDQLKPYFEDPSTCGYDSDLQRCQYITADGKMCAVGKNLIDPKSTINGYGLTHVLGEDQENLKPEARGKLLEVEWDDVQSIHDSIKGSGTLMDRIEKLELDSGVNLQELKDLAILLPN